MSLGVPPGQTNADGTFLFTGVPPGAYYFAANLPGGTPARPTWTLKSATLNGRDVLDTPLDVRPGEDIGNVDGDVHGPRDVTVGFTDRSIRAGRLLDTS